jgi:hypothetical protein
LDFIPHKVHLYDFLEELGLFSEKPRFLRKKKIRRFAVCRDFMAAQMKILSAQFWKVAFKSKTSLFGSLKELVSLGLFSFFHIKNKFRQVAAIRSFGSFFTFT